MKKYTIISIIVMGCMFMLSCTESDSPSSVSYQLPLEVIWSQVYGREAYDEYAVCAVATDWNQIVVAANSFSTGFYDVSGWLFFTRPGYTGIAEMLAAINVNNKHEMTRCIFAKVRPLEVFILYLSNNLKYISICQASYI